MDKSTHGIVPVRNEKTGTDMEYRPMLLSEQEFARIRSTSAFDKARSSEFKRGMYAGYLETFDLPHDKAISTAIAIEVLRDKIEELETTSIGEYESITGRKLDITYLRKSIELLTKK